MHDVARGAQPEGKSIMQGLNFKSKRKEAA